MTVKKDYIQKISEKAERRFFLTESDMDGETGMISGIAAVVNRTTDMGWYYERFAPGAFTDRLEDDVVALLNHDPNFPLARTTANEEAKLHLSLTDEGHLAYRFKKPETNIGNDIDYNIRHRIITKSSVAFTVESEEWTYADTSNGLDMDLRTITKIGRLFDVSPVTYPAYDDTSVAVRSLEQTKTDFDRVREEIEEIDNFLNKLK